MEIWLKLRWKVINVTRNVNASMVIHISHAINTYNKIAMRMCTNRLLVATPSESDPKQTDAATEPVFRIQQI